ncbi:hypothetical protein LWI28_002179 [Acer negundo]|uniref:Transglycosylase SLT domain-containing protein n=1 Tax=Acer negundo TaxID=4023 RepID=A0AAD5IBN3_ACENE|nr:hypothetical protein LWI28_002179 [Acer negundo]KAK4838314.1 hypothetical protein QYF36_012802 [Acer negundo]
MAVSFKYWDDCVERVDMEAMWMDAGVSTEWLEAGETRENKVHLSRDPDGQPYLTQTEMKAVVKIVVKRHFDSHIDPDMISAIAELESDRQILATQYDRKTKETFLGLMQISPKTALWLVSELGYLSHEVDTNPEVLYRPLISIYFGAAYLKWLSNFQESERSEEFIVRAYKGGTKKATHKSTLPYWKRYVSVKESLPTRKFLDDGPSLGNASAFGAPATQNTEVDYWDARTSPEDMELMWNHPEVVKEWTKSGEKRGQVRFSRDAKNKAYLSQVELKAVAEIILSKYFSTKAAKPTFVCALAEMVSMRFVRGIEPRIGIMGLDYSLAYWIYMELGYRAYRFDSVEDLTKPFVSVYFAAAYLAWLSEYEGRERTPQFVVQAYLSGPKNVNLQQTGPSWLKFEQALSSYDEGAKRSNGSCTIL